MRELVLAEIVKAAKTNPDIVFLTGDLGYNVVEKFQNSFPERFFNMGVAEQNMMSVAAGLALENKKVFVYSIGNFASLRCLEQLRNDICFLNLDVNIISVGAGLKYGNLGFSHQATEDMACVLSLPNIKVYNPANLNEAKLVMAEVLKERGPKYIRLGATGQDYPLLSTPPFRVIEGKDKAIFCTGAIVDEAIKAAKMVDGLAVYSCPVLDERLERALPKILKNYKYAFTLEEHCLKGGLSGVFERCLAKMSSNRPIYRPIGIKKEICQLKSSRTNLLKAYKIDAKSIAKTIDKIVK